MLSKTFKSPLYLTLTSLFILSINSSLGQQITVQQDPKFEQLLQDRKKLVSSATTSINFKIQIFNGSSTESKKILIDFKNQFKNQDATIVFSTPLYKVWVGNYKTRIDAERNLAVLRRNFPNALLIKPSN
ncbi:MAG: hypothetical protein ACJAQ1_000510 [Flavobacterium sp.]|jgi:hypothetical protein